MSNSTSSPNSILLPPWSEEAEEKLLGCVLNAPHLLDELSDTFRSEHFFSERHKWIWDAVKTIRRRGGDVLLLSIAEELGPERWGKCGKGEFPADYHWEQVTLSVPFYMVSSAREYARIVRDKYLLRKLKETAEAIGAAIIQDLPAADTVQLAQEALLTLQVEGSENEPASYTQLLSSLYDKMEQWRSGKGSIGIATPWPGQDEITGGLIKGELEIWASRPGMGKSAALAGMAINAAMMGKKVFVSSMEMSDEQVAHRITAQMTNLSTQDQRHLDDAQWRHFMNFVESVKPGQWGDNLFIDDGGTFDEDGVLTPEKLRAKAFKHKAKYGLDLIIVDYLQLMSGDSKRFKDSNARVAEVTHIAQALKRLAMALDVPVIAAAQLSRAVEARADKRPMLSDLRESGGIEQAADKVIFIYRDGYYKEDPDNISTTDNLTEFITAKHRNGPTGKETVLWNRQSVRFEHIGNRIKTIDLSKL